jgi:hypothetical protein
MPSASPRLEPQRLEPQRLEPQRLEPQTDTRRELAYFIETRRRVLRYARTFPPGAERNQHRQIVLSLRRLFRNRAWLSAHTQDG